MAVIAQRFDRHSRIAADEFIPVSWNRLKIKNYGWGGLALVR
jgi:hypothetical protein